MGGTPGRASLITAGVLGATSCAKATPQARFAASTENEKSCNGLLRRIIIVSPPQLLLREAPQKVIRGTVGAVYDRAQFSRRHSQKLCAVIDRAYRGTFCGF